MLELVPTHDRNLQALIARRREHERHRTFEARPAELAMLDEYEREER